MKYMRVRWVHSLPGEPVTLLSELDDDRFEVRKLEVFRDGSTGRASADACLGPTALGELPIPSLDEISKDPQFRAEEITQSEFEAAWRDNAMNVVNAPDELRTWYESRESAWQLAAMTTQLRLPDAPGQNKATITFETPGHVASITVWGAGALEFIILDLATHQEAVVADREYDSKESLWSLLDDCMRDLIALVRKFQGS